MFYERDFKYGPETVQKPIVSKPARDLQVGEHGARIF